MEHYGMRVW